MRYGAFWATTRKSGVTARPAVANRRDEVDHRGLGVDADALGRRTHGWIIVCLNPIQVDAVETQPCEIRHFAGRAKPDVTPPVVPVRNGIAARTSRRGRR